jgi:maltose O-acetyltransferase
MKERISYLLFTMPRGLASRIRIALFRALGMRVGRRNRFERVRCRRLSQIQIGEYNSLTEGCWLWPLDTDSDEVRIKIGSGNYFNRNVMIDACGLIEVGDDNMFGPGIYITDSNHSVKTEVSPKALPMQVGRVKIGNRCWIGAHAVILKDVELGDGCVVGAGAVVTRSVPPGTVVAGVPARVIHSAALSSADPELRVVS